MRRTFLKTVIAVLASTSATVFGIDIFGGDKTPAETDTTPPATQTKDKVDILFFTASWCGPCQSLKAQLKREGLYKFVTVMDCSDGKAFSKYAKAYKFRGVPTLIVVVNDKEVARNDKQSASTLIRKYAPK